MTIDLRSRRLAIAAVAGLALAVYANSLGNGFAYDDVEIVRENPRVHSLRTAVTAFAQPYWPERIGGSAFPLYRPVTIATFAVDWALWGGRPFGFHLTNVLLHALAAGLLTALLLRFAPLPAAALGGALFAVHPVHTEAVANVVGRAELLAAVGVFAALLLVVRAADTEDPGRTPARLAVAAAAAYLFAALSKESALVLPALVLLVDAARERWAGVAQARAYLRRRAPLYLALAVVVGVVLAARWVVLGVALGGDRPAAWLDSGGFATRFFTMIRVWPEYARLLFAPFELSADYAPAVLLPADGLRLRGALGLGLAAAALGLGALLWRRAPWAAAGIFWAPIALLPVSNLVFSTGVVLAERTLYLPSAGVSLLVAGLAPPAAWGPAARRWAAAAALALLALLAAGTVLRNPVWNDTESVFRSVLRTHPESYRAHWVIAQARAAEGRWAEAEDGYREAIRLWPRDPDLWADLATQYLMRGEPEKAAEAARQAKALSPGLATPYHFQAMSLLGERRWMDAARVAEQGLRLFPDDAVLYHLLFQAREALGDDRGAADALRASLVRSNPNWHAWTYLARLYARAGRPQEAAAALDSAEARGADADAARRIAALRDSLVARP